MLNIHKIFCHEHNKHKETTFYEQRTKVASCFATTIPHPAHVIAIQSKFGHCRLAAYVKKPGLTYREILIQISNCFLVNKEHFAVFVILKELVWGRNNGSEILK